MSFSDGTADFRSDTVTRPTEAMRRAMAEAEVGDDVYGDDPTVNLLEEEAASVVGKQAAVFTPTGTMGNQLAILLHTRPGEEVLCDEGAHARNVERGAAAALSGVAFRSVHAPGGAIEADQVDAVMATAGSFFPRVRLLIWENSHNLSGGRVVPVETMRSTGVAAKRHGLAVHLDGARLFNAAAALDLDPAEIAAQADTVQFCFSKGLGAPIGSILCGDEDLIDEARYLRGRLGGAMRQVGVIAAAARVALADRDRLVDDNARARRLGEAIAERAPDAVDVEAIDTNIVNVHPGHLGDEWPMIASRLAEAGVRSNPPLTTRWRLVTHRDVDDTDVNRLVGAVFPV